MKIVGDMEIKIKHVAILTWFDHAANLQFLHDADDKFQLDVVTTDKDLLVTQFELWVRQAGDYARKKKATDCKNLVQNQIKAEEEITKKNIASQLAKHPVSEIPTIEEAPIKNPQ